MRRVKDPKPTFTGAAVSSTVVFTRHAADAVDSFVTARAAQRKAGVAAEVCEVAATGRSARRGAGLAVLSWEEV